LCKQRDGRGVVNCDNDKITSGQGFWQTTPASHQFTERNANINAQQRI
jgi:hypothetical protein